MRHAHFISSVALVAATVIGGCRSDQTKGYQVVRKEGTPLTITTNEAVAVRL